MIFARRFFCCLLLCAPLVCAASDASTPQDVADNLKGKVVFLRGMGSGDKLAFDAQGAATGTVAAGPFALSAVKVEAIHQSSKDLEIKGTRVLMVFLTASDSPTMADLNFVGLSKQVDISIAIDSEHPDALEATVQKVFAFNLHDALTGGPAEEQAADLASIGTMAPPGKKPMPVGPNAGLPPGVYKAGPPRLFR